MLLRIKLKYYGPTSRNPSAMIVPAAPTTIMLQDCYLIRDGNNVNFAEGSFFIHTLNIVDCVHLVCDAPVDQNGKYKSQIESVTLKAPSIEIFSNSPVSTNSIFLSLSLRQTNCHMLATNLIIPKDYFIFSSRITISIGRK